MVKIDYDFSLAELEVLGLDSFAVQCRCGHDSFVTIHGMVARFGVSARVRTVISKFKCGFCEKKTFDVIIVPSGRVPRRVRMERAWYGEAKKRQSMQDEERSRRGEERLD